MMEKATLEDVIARLDRLEGLLSQLVDALRTEKPAASRPVSSPTPAPPAAPYAFDDEPPVVSVAPAQAYRPPPVTEPVAETSKRSASISDLSDAELRIPGPEAGVEDVLVRVFEVAMVDNIEETWEVMQRLTHSSQLVGPRAVAHFRSFAWDRLRRMARDYLVAERPGHYPPNSYEIVRWDPKNPGPEVDRLRVFVQAPDDRMPVPVGFARDPEDNMAWRITKLSL